MPLSEEELRMLEQMERALLAEDPKFASALRGSRVRSNARKRIVISAAAFVGGIALLMGGVMARVEIVGILGFVVMLGAAVFGLTALRSRTAVGADPAEHATEGLTVIEGGRRPRRSGRSRSGASSSGSFMERMEERWRRRRDNGGY
ncbi:DUF3040 domain-containing protein [Nocardioides zeae]|uniref:DUF3040 domain-containing protein n=1 Tax=Nocardioides imazamoxiresistens TaxID=3231893 RepID=A0ABU3PZ95_9ACTN|nr:DUF3040 domain-containing protein [Nocardioides zeae]MDT9594496.1 DUF3040 domain-containing protein [Nocardioides zeae]